MMVVHEIFWPYLLTKLSAFNMMTLQRDIFSLRFFRLYEKIISLNLIECESIL